jgi:hypothetical protein
LEKKKTKNPNKKLSDSEKLERKKEREKKLTNWYRVHMGIKLKENEKARKKTLDCFLATIKSHE